MGTARHCSLVTSTPSQSTELVLGVRCLGVEFILCSFHKFLDEVLLYHDNYKFQVYGYDTTLFIGQQHPITVYGTGFWVCVVLVFSVICVPFVDTRGEVIGRFTNKHNLCILNDGTHTYLKPQAQHANKPTSAIDLIISTPGLALRSVWEVLPDTHGSDNYPILTSILPSVAEIQPSCDPSHWVFCKANWEQFRDVCMESISEDILEEAETRLKE